MIQPEITAKYWKWIYNHPENESPLKTGKVNMDDTIMLPCTGGGAACDREVLLTGEDANKSILVPVFAAMRYGIATRTLMDMARAMSTADKMEMSIDDVPQDYEYVEAKNFAIKGFEAVSSGYWHVHGPLPKGKHVIKFGGNGKYDKFFTKVQYEVEVR